MVSGLVTSPCDQLRIFSGEARLMRMASKSAIGFARSKGLERNKVFLHFLLSRQQPVASGQLPVLMFRQGRERTPCGTVSQICLRARWRTDNSVLATRNCSQSAAAACTGFLSPVLISSTARHSDCN